MQWMHDGSHDHTDGMTVGTMPGMQTQLHAVINKPGVFEVPNGTTTFRDLFERSEYGGGVRNGHRLKAFIPGGASAPFFYEEHLDLPLEAQIVMKKGSMLGSGAIIVMDESTDMVKASRSLVRFFATESCGKCTPCREGTTWLERIYDRIIEGEGRPEDVDVLLDICDNISPGMAWPPKQTTICPLGQSATPSVASVIRRFPEEFERYLGTTFTTTVELRGAAYLTKPTVAVGVASQGDATE